MRRKIQHRNSVWFQGKLDLAITLLNAFTLKLITDIEQAIKKTLVLRLTLLYYIKQYFKSEKAFVC